jgi:hypothetical protein
MIRVRRGLVETKKNIADLLKTNEALKVQSVNIVVLDRY